MSQREQRGMEIFSNQLSGVVQRNDIGVILIAPFVERQLPWRGYLVRTNV
jgi:hypothetical protein